MKGRNASKQIEVYATIVESNEKFLYTLGK